MQSSSIIPDSLSQRDSGRGSLLYQAIIPVESAPTSIRVSVLIVDDHRDGREMVGAFFAFSGFDVNTAPNGIEAIALAERAHPNVVLMDLWLPGEIDGFETTRRLKAHPVLKDTPVIALTGLALPRHRAAAMQAGCEAVFVKPYDMCELATYIDRAIRSRPIGLGTS